MRQEGVVLEVDLSGAGQMSCQGERLHGGTGGYEDTQTMYNAT